mmetsp:Transcript_16325/g.26181  ORF Transcript_16325/g.26181 Transcript_16325/m.26181 type:complete len:150 (+) Transcript_16325:777-1226(+)
MYHVLSCMIVNHAMCHSLFSLSFSVFLACVILALPLTCDGSLVRGRVFKVYRNSLACVCACLFCAILTRRQTLPCVILVHASLSLVHHSLFLPHSLFMPHSLYFVQTLLVVFSRVHPSSSFSCLPVSHKQPCHSYQNFSPMCHSFKYTE